MTTRHEWLLNVLESKPAWLLEDNELVITGSGAEITLVARESDQLLGRTFESTDVTEDGEPKELLPDTVVRIGFLLSGQAEANAGCNVKDAPVRLDDGLIEATQGWITTDMGCGHPHGPQDDWLVDILTAKPAWRLDDDTLVISSGGTEITLDDTGETAAWGDPQPAEDR